MRPGRGVLHTLPASVGPVAPGPGWMAKPSVSKEIQCSDQEVRVLLSEARLALGFKGQVGSGL